MILSNVPVGQKAIIRSLTTNPIVRAKLLDLGMIPGTVFTMKRQLTWSNALQIHVRQANLIIRNAMANEIEVQVIN